MLSALNRFSMVGKLSSAAKRPLPEAKSACAVDSSVVGKLTVRVGPFSRLLWWLGAFGHAPLRRCLLRPVFHYRFVLRHPHLRWQPLALCVRWLPATMRTTKGEAIVKGSSKKASPERSMTKCSKPQRPTREKITAGQRRAEVQTQWCQQKAPATQAGLESSNAINRRSAHRFRQRHHGDNTFENENL